MPGFRQTATTFRLPDRSLYRGKRLEGAASAQRTSPYTHVMQTNGFFPLWGRSLDTVPIIE